MKNNNLDIKLIETLEELKNNQEIREDIMNSMNEVMPYIKEQFNQKISENITDYDDFKTFIKEAVNNYSLEMEMEAQTKSLDSDDFEIDM